MRPGRRPAAAAVAGAAVAPLVGAAVIGAAAAVVGAVLLFPLPAVAQRAAGARQTAAAQPSQDTPHVSVGPNLRLVAGEHNEAWIAASGTNPDFLVAVAQTGGGVVRSTRRETVTLGAHDGGRLWAPVTLPGYTTGAFDPMVVAGPGGRMYVMHALLADFSADAPRAPPPPIR
ncbi:MAG: hypothetical protein FIA95_15190, partial [Gemmatimonadetes bacterium]|nr:hypothetical protein [Gemmatimonadota bacterium]